MHTLYSTKRNVLTSRINKDLCTRAKAAMLKRQCLRHVLASGKMSDVSAFELDLKVVKTHRNNLYEDRKA